MIQEARRQDLHFFYTRSVAASDRNFGGLAGYQPQEKSMWTFVWTPDARASGGPL